MSYTNFIKAMELAPKCKFYTTAGGKSEEEIDMSEKKLGISFSPQCKEFYKKYSGILEGNSVAYALNDREEYNLPKEWIPIYDFGDGNMAYLDYSSLNMEKEPSVIMAFYNGDKYEINETLAEDLGDFLLQLVQEQLEN